MYPNERFDLRLMISHRIKLMQSHIHPTLILATIEAEPALAKINLKHLESYVQHIELSSL